jgi:hypothetical protein
VGMVVSLLWMLCALSNRGFCDGVIPRPEESYRVCVCVCDLETEQWGSFSSCSFLTIFAYIFSNLFSYLNFKDILYKYPSSFSGLNKI